MTKTLFTTLSLVTMSLVSTAANSAWLTVTGEIDSISVYGHRDTVVFRLTNDGKPTTCSNTRSFAISDQISAERRSQLLSFLMANDLAKRKITVSYLDNGNCEAWDSNEDAIRRVTRITHSSD